MVFALADCAPNKPRLRRVVCAPHPLNQSGQHESYIVESRTETDVLLFCEETKVPSEEKKVFQFTRRACGDIQKLAEFRSASPSATLGDICRDRERGSPHLVGNAVSLVFGEWSCGAINTNNQRVALLPNLGLFEILHCLTTQAKCDVYLQLVTNNCQPPAGFPC